MNDKNSNEVDENVVRKLAGLYLTDPETVKERMKQFSKYELRFIRDNVLFYAINPFKASQIQVTREAGNFLDNYSRELLSDSNNYTEEQKLDMVLDFFRGKHKTMNVWRDSVTKYFDAERFSNFCESIRESDKDELFKQRMEFFIDEGLIKINNQGNAIHTIGNWELYSCTYRGYAFKGFVKDKSEKEADKIRKDRNDNRLSNGTIALAIGTIGLLLFELFKWLLSYFYPSC
jgi:hypothetical protein